MEQLWHLTQRPEEHQRWDLRFSEIRYLPKPDADQPQEFLYATRIGFGLKIEGRGESVGERTALNGERSSSLKFWSEDKKSLIRKGAGYWKYVPATGGVKFLTLYDYGVRFGWAGIWIDKLIFRPLMGWATAWSFDRLRIWIETGSPPDITLRTSVVHAIARWSVALAWLWHGLVPKLIARHPDEVLLVTDAGFSARFADVAVIIAGGGEILLGLCILVLWKSRWPMVATVLLMIAATIGVAVYSPEFLEKPFNPVTLNLLMISSASIALTVQSRVASAARCRRTKARRGT